MLHEILLALSGYPSPLLPPPEPPPQISRPSSAPSPGPSPTAPSHPSTLVSSVLTPPERVLLAPLARLAELHTKLQAHAAQVAASHASTVCRAVAAAVMEGPLAEFRRHVLDVEDAVLRRDARLVGDGGPETVPLTAVTAEFTPWMRRMQWLWEVVVGGFLVSAGSDGQKESDAAAPAEDGETKTRTRKASDGRHAGAGSLVDLLRGEMVSGYADVEVTARRLAAAAERMWLKQVSAWILYGRLPTFGRDDFFVRPAGGDDGDQDFTCDASLLPSFVSAESASSMLFIGRSLAHIRLHNSALSSSLQSPTHLSEQLAALSQLSFPLDPAAFARAVAAVRLSLSRNTLQKLLPLERVLDVLRLLRDFFLLERGEFAVALVQEADERLRSRWKGRSESAAAAAAYQRRDGLAAVVVREGEVAGILAKTWAALLALQGRHAEEDEGLELARDLIRLNLLRAKPQAPLEVRPGRAQSQFQSAGPDVTLASTPFRNLLLAVPVSLTLRIPSPLDMFLTPSDLAVYSAINAYLLAIRRTHVHLTGLWKVTSLRRHHPAPPGPPRGSSRTGRARVVLLRTRGAQRAGQMRALWVTCSAAVFLLAETEAYLQADVVAGMWEGFHAWLAGKPGDGNEEKGRVAGKSRQSFLNPSEPADGQPPDDHRTRTRTRTHSPPPPSSRDSPSPPPSTPSPPPHDPQTLGTAHQTYLAALAHHLLLTSPSFTDPLYALLTHLEHLVALVHRLHAIWGALDLEVDAGVVDAFVDFEAEERDVRAELRGVQARVRDGVGEVVEALRGLAGQGDLGGGELTAPRFDPGAAEAGGGSGSVVFVPPRIGGAERLLMKLDFGVWFGDGSNGGAFGDEF